MNAPMRIVVTGGAGFIASNIVDRLLTDGHEVVVLDNFDPYYDPAQKRANIRLAQKNENYRLVEADVRDRAAVDRVFSDFSPEHVVHLAAKAGVRSSMADPASYVTVNELGGLNVLDACRQGGSIPMILASTSSAYGRAPAPFKESHPAVGPLSPYAASKRGAELMAHAYRDLYDSPIAILRFFTVYGPRGRPDMATWMFTEAIQAGKSIYMHGEDTERDFTFVDDIVDGVVGAMSWLTKTRGFDTFNLGRSDPYRVRTFIETLAKLLGREATIEVGTLQPGESRVTCADISHATDAFGYQPKISLEEGLARWVQWYEHSDESPLHRRAPRS